MTARTNLDMDVLRTFVLGFELGSFARAAERLGRSQSAVSSQLRRLEDQIGQPLVQKAGRGLALTTVGEALLSYARRLLELNDEAVETVRGAGVEGWARLGLPQDFAESFLPAVLGRFARAHPRARIAVHVDRTAELIERTLRGELDLALVWGDEPGTPHHERVAEIGVAWIAHAEWPGLAALGGEPLPLIAFAPACQFRTAGIAALDAAGIAWRLVFTSPSLAGLWAAAAAGLGVTVRTAIGRPHALAAVDAAAGLPALPPIALTLHRAEAEPGPAVARLRELVLSAVRDAVAGVPPAAAIASDTWPP
ncbi:MAG TPA: LysR substrate-binding domain-containing protein [Kofleriaceae bacterium]|nr:LysR substrate-binding domain-containing protein [Kofleriaceae bacterium]